MDKKVRYKLRKVKKRWVTVSVASAVMTLTTLSGGLVKADSNESKSQISNDSNTSVVTANEESNVTTEVTSKQEAASSQTNHTVTTSSSSTSVVNPKEVVSNPYTVGETASNGEKLQNQITTVDKTSEAAANNISKQTTEADTDVIDDSNAANLQILEKLPNVKEIDGKYYYYDNNGKVRTNFTLIADGKILHFDETGAYTDTSIDTVNKDIVTTRSNLYKKYNQVYDRSAQSFEHVDHYLTAESWYRPKYILKDGKTWTQSTEKDFRPLLMTWWPSQETQRQYVNYMNAQLGINKTYDDTSNQLQLNIAAATIQAKIEAKITTLKNTDWLRQTISAFVKTQSAWNSDSEKPFDDHLQNGAVLYDNEGKLTPYANSNYRILNRTPTNQTGKKDPRYTADNTIGGYEFLLANDVDNSNPVVQAEQLNWLHFLMNFGNIYANDPDANFDSIRVDAVDNVDADLLQIAGDYLKAAKGIHKNDKAANDHLSILE
ncbi:glucosyltransferase, partial [Streptococcus mutans]|nr:glucosyltransferase [Streptococcus mutans]